MTFNEKNPCFFEELEATAKRLSIISATNRSTSELTRLFDELRTLMVEEDAVHTELRQTRSR